MGAWTLTAQHQYMIPVQLDVNGWDRWDSSLLSSSALSGGTVFTVWIQKQWARADLIQCNKSHLWIPSDQNGSATFVHDFFFQGRGQCLGRMTDFPCSWLWGRHVRQSGFLADDARGRRWSGRGPDAVCRVLLSGHFSGTASSNH